LSLYGFGEGSNISGRNIPLRLLQNKTKETKPDLRPQIFAMGFRDGGSSRFSIQNILNLVLRFLQIIFALAVVGLYAQDLNKARKVGKYSDSKWVTINHCPSIKS